MIYGPEVVGKGEWYVYDAHIGSPGLIIEGTVVVVVEESSVVDMLGLELL
jgi:hypothetical protein